MAAQVTIRLTLTEANLVKGILTEAKDEATRRIDTMRNSAGSAREKHEEHRMLLERCARIEHVLTEFG